VFLKVLVRFTYLFIFRKKFSISFSLYFIFFTPFGGCISFLLCEHRTLFSRRSHVKGSWLLHLRHFTPPMYRHYVLHTHTYFHLYFSIYHFFSPSRRIYRVIIIFFFYYSSLRNRLLTSLLRLYYMNSNKPFKHLHNNACPCGKRILIQLKAVFESRKIYQRILETLIEFSRRIYYTAARRNYYFPKKINTASENRTMLVYTSSLKSIQLWIKHTNLVDEWHDVCGYHFVGFVLLFSRCFGILIYIWHTIEMHRVAR